MHPPTAWPLQVFYDGACPLCSRECALYAKRDRFHHIQWINIAGADFDAARFNLNPTRLQQVMHARTADGRVYTELSAFVKIWQALPATPLTVFLRGLFKIPGVLAIGGVFYRLFARNRYRLTGRCSPESCSIN